MKKIFNSKTIGLIALALAICLNYVHAINNYGVLENNLYWKVLGQTSSSGDGSGESSGGNTSQKNCPPGICHAGGCGASSCRIKVSVFGNERELETHVGPGYFACCYTDTWGNGYAQSYLMKDCCQ